jgi:hypothetical protein
LVTPAPIGRESKSYVPITNQTFDSDIHGSWRRHHPRALIFRKHAAAIARNNRCRDPNTIYTAEINDWRAQKILLKGETMKTNSQGKE